MDTSLSNSLSAARPDLALPEVLVAPGVLDAIRAETMRYASEDEETGGIVVGTWISPNSLLVVAATGPGPHADHQRLTFAIDVDYANTELDRLRDAHPGVDYVGEWHKHPPALDRPSGGDVQTARSLMTDPTYPDRLVNPITIIRDAVPLVGFFFIDRSRPDFTRVQPRELSADEMAVVLALPVVPVPPVAATGETAPLAPIIPWWLRPGGALRLAEEQKALEGGKFTLVNDAAVEGSRIVTIHDATQGGGLSIVLECYGNYPNNAPRLLDVARNGKGVPLTQLASPTLSEWQPDRALAQVCEDIRRSTRRRGQGVPVLLIALAALLVVAVIGAVVTITQNNLAQSRQNQDTTATAFSLGQSVRGAAATLTIGANETAVADGNATATAAIEQTNSANNATITALQQSIESNSATSTALAAPADTPPPAAAILPPTPSVRVTQATATGFTTAAHGPITALDEPLAANRVLITLDLPQMAGQGWLLTITTGNTALVTARLDTQYTSFAERRLAPCAAQPCTLALTGPNGASAAPAILFPTPLDPAAYYIIAVAQM